MYARELDGQTLTLGVSGLLWNRSLVMYDKETGSNWSHILGEAKQGKLRGKRLEQIPSVITDWQSWRRQYPDSTVVLLSRTSGEYNREFYNPPRQFVLGIVNGDKAKAWGFDRLLESLAINDQFSGKPVLAAFDRGSMTPRLYHRTLDDRVLTFRAVGDNIKDRETGSAWEPVTGRATAGPLAGKYLTALPAIVSYRRVWLKFHPKSELADSDSGDCDMEGNLQGAGPRCCAR
ncbi:MAG: DUF3179 domain-containing protein [Planctomycetes bacterium]|nr:DUF3179 domain-containing protein [Planctomycetota bacterium]